MEGNWTENIKRGLGIVPCEQWFLQAGRYGRESTASNRLIFHRACACTWRLRQTSNDVTSSWFAGKLWLLRGRPRFGWSWPKIMSCTTPAGSPKRLLNPFFSPRTPVKKGSTPSSSKYCLVCGIILRNESLYALSRPELLSALNAILQTTVQFPQRSYPCGKNCLTCKYISDGQTSYIFHATGETRPITNHIDCNSKNVIYMIQCNHCSKQYIGETKRRLKDRSTNTADQLITHLIPLNPPQSQNTFLPMITLLTTSHSSHQSLPNLIETVYEKLERHTSSREVKLLNL